MSQTFVVNERTYMCGCLVSNGCKCKKQRPTPQPMPSNEAAWESIFNAAKRKEEQLTEQTTNQQDSKHTPLGHPVWVW
jgi:hypothetical protein